MTPRLSIRGLSKSFAAPVLQQVDLDIAPGSVHGLVGENGAGKSTLINIVSGLLDPDEGQMSLNNESYSASDRRGALTRGIALASQELSLIETLSVAENMCLSALPQRALSIDKGRTNQQADGLIELLGIENVNPGDLVSNLSLAEKQLIELGKSLSMPEQHCQLLILDEPTSALTGPQSDRLHQIIRARAAAGLSVIYVSHRLDDVLEVCDVVSVLRDGVIQLTADTNSLSSDDLIRAMSGDELLSDTGRSSRTPGAARLRVENLSSNIFPVPISFDCHRGEILGVAGLAGSGRSELLHTIFGLASGRNGQVELTEDNSTSKIDSPSDAVAQGVALIAEDRKTQGIFSDKPITVNTTMAGLGKLGGLLSAVLPRREISVSETLIDRLKIKCEGPLQSIDRLSGGNQQKVLIARWLQSEAEVWLLDEPTRGVDVTSKLAIHKQLRELRDQGAAILVVSSELEELTALCDRIMVLSDKKHVASFNRGEWTKEALLQAAFSEYTNARLANQEQLTSHDN